tara:strand:+ start:2766 stop:3491 length:726 start_codon:yes stop_codon:yes gene_type:complete
MNKKKPSKKTSASTRKKELRFEDCYDIINEEIAKRRGKWNLSVISWMDFEDVSQILRIHIYKKWHLYDQSKNLKPWIRTIIGNQIKNLIRNNYTNFVKPCVKCAAAVEETGCNLYGKQSSDCPLYKNWEKNKKSGYQAKMPLSLENHPQEVYCLPSSNEFNLEISIKNLSKKMKEVLKPHEWKIYCYLYVDNLSDLEVAKKMGYKTSEKNRSPGYKQIKNVKKKIISKAKECIENDEIDIF